MVAKQRSSCAHTMASIRTSMFMPDIAGKIGGTTTQRGRFGHSVLNASRPPRTWSPVLSNRRGNFGTVSTQWRAISQSDRDQWIAIAQLVTRVSRLGVVYVPSGYQLFVECVLNRSLLGNGIVTTPPVALPVFPHLINFGLENVCE